MIDLNDLFTNLRQDMRNLIANRVGYVHSHHPEEVLKGALVGLSVTADTLIAACGSALIDRASPVKVPEVPQVRTLLDEFAMAVAPEMVANAPSAKAAASVIYDIAEAMMAEREIRMLKPKAKPESTP